MILYHTAKQTINKMRRQATKQERIFINHTSNKVLISKVYKELVLFNTKNSNLKMNRVYEQILLQRRNTDGKGVQHH